MFTSCFVVQGYLQSNGSNPQVFGFPQSDLCWISKEHTVSSLFFILYCNCRHQVVRRLIQCGQNGWINCLERQNRPSSSYLHNIICLHNKTNDLSFFVNTTYWSVMNLKINYLKGKIIRIMFWNSQIFLIEKK